MQQMYWKRQSDNSLILYAQTDRGWQPCPQQGRSRSHTAVDHIAHAIALADADRFSG
jgi:hypothetical protein